MKSIDLPAETAEAGVAIRTAGSALAENEEEMLEFAVENGVELVVLTTHSDCAAEKLAASPEQRQRYPALTRAVDERDRRIHDFLARHAIAERIKAGKLIVKLLDVETLTERLLPKDT